jgi:hypothetical protein
MTVTTMRAVRDARGERGWVLFWGGRSSTETGGRGWDGEGGGGRGGRCGWGVGWQGIWEREGERFKVVGSGNKWEESGGSMSIHQAVYHLFLFPSTKVPDPMNMGQEGINRHEVLGPCLIPAYVVFDALVSQSVHSTCNFDGKVGVNEEGLEVTW